MSVPPSVMPPHRAVLPSMRSMQDKETATKIASDAAATPKQPADGEPESSTPGTSPAKPPLNMATGGGADLDAYIKDLLSMPAPGGPTEDQGQDGVAPPPPGKLHRLVLCPGPLKQLCTASAHHRSSVQCLNFEGSPFSFGPLNLIVDKAVQVGRSCSVFCVWLCFAFAKVKEDTARFRHLVIYSLDHRYRVRGTS